MQINRMIMPLILIITRDCNLRCDYCGIDKKKIQISKRVAEKATLLYLDYIKSSGAGEAKIRFFGGEPLLQWSLIKDVIKLAKKETAKNNLTIKFDLTTNGLLLNAEKIMFFRKNPEIELIISLDGDSLSQNRNRNFFGKSDSYKNIYNFRRELSALPNITVNMVIAPNQARKFHKNFTHIYDLGFKRFNFLPAYFVFWPKEGLKFLKNGFSEILQLIKNGGDISVKNLEISGEAPFFNQGFVVDCDGSIYHTNIFLSKHFEGLSDGLQKGNILDDELIVLSGRKTGDTTKLIKNNTNPKLYYSTLKADGVLSNFVLKLKNIYAKN